MAPDAEYTERLFSYGTLQLESIQRSTFGRLLTGTGDVLPGYERALLEIDDPAVAWALGQTHYAIARFTGRGDDALTGMVFDLTPAELQDADAYETEAYTRVAVILQSGVRAWAYVDARDPSPIQVTEVPLDAIRELREQYRREMACQIVHDSWHARGLTRSYLLRVHGQLAGHGSVGGAPGVAMDTVKEFFVLPPFRGDALPLFRQLVTTSGARTIEAQTNDPLLLLMLYDCASDISSDRILFTDGATTALDAPAPHAVMRAVTESDRDSVFPHSREPVGEWVLDIDGQVVATGGLAFHYNRPYGDIYMEVAAVHHQKGYGSYLVQELKRICYEMGCIPAARCNHDNIASRRTLQRAGMFPCARMMRGAIDR